MANWELKLVSAIVEADDRSAAYKKAIGTGLSLKHFSTGLGRSVWSMIVSHYTRPREFGHIPSKELLLSRFPSLDLPQGNDAIADCCEQIKQSFVSSTVENYLQEYENQRPQNPLSAASDLSAKLQQLMTLQTVSNDISWKERALPDLCLHMQMAEEHGAITGMPYPWRVMNEATGGIHPGDLIMIWALPKGLKSWCGFFIAANLFRMGHRVLIYSAEMNWEQIHLRLCCILAKTDYRRAKRGELGINEQLNLFEWVRKTSDPNFPGEVIFTDGMRPDGSPGGPSEIMQKIQIYEPAFVMLDSSYMLEIPGVKDALDWKAIAAVTRGIKRVAKSTGVPTLAILQENERAAVKYGGSGRASMAMWTGAIMDCDVGVRLVRNRQKQELSLWFAACRETDFPGFTINTQLCENTEFAHLHLHSIGDDDEEATSGENASTEAPTYTQERLVETSTVRPTDELSGDLEEFLPDDE